MEVHWELLLRLLIAAALGSFIGAERERLIWAAGLRTHMLVCVGACLFMVVSAHGFTDVLGPGVAYDPSRVAAQVVSGIGFLGAGSILLRGDLVRGLTTAASLWTVAAIGLAVGGGLYVEATAATVIILVILAGIKPLGKWFQDRNQSLNLTLRVSRGSMTIDTINKLLGAGPAKVSRFVCVASDEADCDDVTMTIKRMSAQARRDLLHRLDKAETVRNAKAR
jgi:putative Mg2+ transporter-C (MgtC) family protein